MAEARGRHEWGQTAGLMAMIHNVAAAQGGGRQKHPNELNPYEGRRPRPRTSNVTIYDLKRAFIGED